jgi:ferredoxin-NADP reductase
MGGDVIADFDANQGDRIALMSATAPYRLADSAEGLQIIQAGIGVTTLLGITMDSFNADTSIVLV